jgi:4-hydroxybenzoate polyprenyltransferase
MTWLTALRLGRVSNLPTVWTNALAAVVLSGGALGLSGWGLLLVGLSLLYVAGMYLNDAFDARIDAVERPSRPIPSGEASRIAVFANGFALLAVGLLCIALFGGGAPQAGVALAVAIVAYDAIHKQTMLAPLLMGLCRFLVYAAAALASGGMFSSALFWGATGLFCYIAGLTYAAKQEAFDRVERMWPLAILAVPFLVGLGFAAGDLQALGWLAVFALWTAGCLYLLRRRQPGDIGRAVSLLLAGISLYDAVLVAAFGFSGLSLLCVAAVPATIAAQRYVPGT